MVTQQCPCGSRPPTGIAPLGEQSFGISALGIPKWRPARRNGALELPQGWRSEPLLLRLKCNARARNRTSVFSVSNQLEQKSYTVTAVAEFAAANIARVLLRSVILACALTTLYPATYGRPEWIAKLLPACASVTLPGRVTRCRNRSRTLASGLNSEPAGSVARHLKNTT